MLDNPRVLYPANLLLLVTHQVEASWCHEWDMFAIPGGIQLFLVLNAVLLAPLLVGSDRVARAAPTAPRWMRASAALGLSAVLIHGGFIAAGDPHFRLAASFVTFAGLALTSALLLRAAPRARTSDRRVASTARRLET